MRAGLSRQWLAGFAVGLSAVGAFWSFLATSHAQPAATLGPTYTADGRLEFPKPYRTWVFLSSGLDMSYLENARAGQSTFGNVFVNPAAYDAFVRNGTWPDKTVLVLEVRSAEQSGSIIKGGRFQSEILRTEVHVKDTARFQGGWGFFGYSDETPAQMIPRSANCYSCHQDNGAVDTTFVQFYPTLIPTARAKQTLSRGYLATEAARK